MIETLQKYEKYYDHTRNINLLSSIPRLYVGIGSGALPQGSSQLIYFSEFKFIMESGDDFYIRFPEIQSENSSQ